MSAATVVSSSRKDTELNAQLEIETAIRADVKATLQNTAGV